MILEMTNAERQYRRNLEVGEAVSMLLNSNENWSEESQTDKYKKALNCTENHKSDMYQHTSMPHWNRGKMKYWHAFNSLPIGRLFGLLVKREVKERLSFKTTSTITRAIDVWLPLTLLLVQRTLPISYQSSHWSAKTYFCSITLVLGQRLLLMAC